MYQLPRLYNVVVLSHVRHRTARGQVRQNHGDRLIGEDVRRLGHEVHAAKDDVFRAALSGFRSCEPAQLETVAGEVDVAQHVILLVMMAEDQQIASERSAAGGDARSQFILGQRLVAFRERWLPTHEIGVS